jgi:hypothetical protein
VARKGRIALARILDFSPVSDAAARLYIEPVPVRGVTMTEFTAWMQSNWYALGNLFIQFGFLAAGVWFARRILRTMRASQEQVGALLKLSFTGAISERLPSMATAERFFASTSPYWLMPSEIPPVPLPETQESGPGRWTVARLRVMVWLQTPMSSGETALWRRATKWLQAPTGG